MDIKIRAAGTADTESYISFLHDVKKVMPNSEWFFLDPDEEVREMMVEGCMKLWFAEAGDRLAGVFSIIYPGLKPFNLGYDLDFDEEQLMRVVHMDTAAVHPDYRGQKLQYRMMMEAEKEIARSGEKILLCTVHPDNCYSIRNVLQQGYVIMKRMGKYGSVRYLLRKDVYPSIPAE